MEKLLPKASRLCIAKQSVQELGRGSLALWFNYSSDNASPSGVRMNGVYGEKLVSGDTNQATATDVEWLTEGIDLCGTIE